MGMRTAAVALIALMLPSLALAGQITLFNSSGGAVELRAVRKGTVTLADGEAKSFLYQAEDGDFRVWAAGTKCEYQFGFEASEDATLQFGKDLALYRLPAGATAALTGPALAAGQPAGWPMKALDKFCD